MTMETVDLLIYCAVFVFGIILFPIMIQGIAAVDMTAWTFAGHAEVASFLTVFPYLFLIGMITGPLYMILRLRSK